MFKPPEKGKTYSGRPSISNLSPAHLPRDPSKVLELFVSHNVPNPKSNSSPGWLVGWLVSWLVGWLADWLVGWLVGCLIG